MDPKSKLLVKFSIFANSTHPLKQVRSFEILSCALVAFC